MSRRFVPLLALMLVAARPPGDPKHENHFAPTSTPAADGLAIDLITAHAQAQFVLVEATFRNTSGDKVFVVKREGATIDLPTGSFGVKAGGLFGGPVKLDPGESRKIGFKAEGAGMHQDQATLKFGDVLVAPIPGKAPGLADFALPAAKNDTSAGPFTCTLEKVKQKTDDTSAGFACQYTGKGLAIVEPDRISVRAPNGQEYANAAKHSPREILLPGEVAKFTVTAKIPAKVADMQFATLQVVWHDALQESPATSVGLTTWAFQLDPNLTAEKNK